jgi:hypothetical protein
MKKSELRAQFINLRDLIENHNSAYEDSFEIHYRRIAFEVFP